MVALKSPSSLEVNAMRFLSRTASVLVVLTMASWIACQRGQGPAPASSVQQPSAAPAPADPLIAGFQKVTVASVCDAIDQVCKKRGWMSHDMRPVVGRKFVGRAVTALVRPARPEESTPANAVVHSIQMIDEAKPGEVGVIVMEGGLEVAALGGLMATAAKARGMAGMVLDGALRDVEHVRRIGLPVFARAISPVNAVGRFKSVAKNVPVECAGVTVRPGDIIVADEDGVVVVPQEQAEQVLKVAQELEEREAKMIPFIEQEKSLQKAVAKFNRI